MQANRSNTVQLFEGFSRSNRMDGMEITPSISGVPVKLKIASNEYTKSIGLMNSDEPEGDHGMMFMYDRDNILEFWMKNVKFPLDILFFDSKLNLVSHTTMAPYNGESDRNLDRYRSERPARFAVELRSGWCTDNLNMENPTLKF